MNTSRFPALQPFGQAGAELAGGAVPMDIVFIEGFTAQTVIGIYANELHAPQTLVVDVYAGVPRAKACITDHIVDTIDYGAVRERLLVLMSEHKLQLLEAMAETIAAILVNEFGAHWVRVKVVKPRKCADVDGMGVLIERTRDDVLAMASASTGQTGSPVLQLIGSGMVPGNGQ